MNYIEEIKLYKPINEQEINDKDIILAYAKDYPQTILLRDNKLAHMTASAIILNKEHTKMLMIHHNIYNTWTWTGGHCDGEEDLLKLALKEANEETGLNSCHPLGGIKSIDILSVQSHIKNNKYVNAHLHLNVAYVFEADESETLILNENETSGLKWVNLREVAIHSGEDEIIYVYHKLFQSAGIII